MKIGIIGAGATGSVFGGYLRRGGADDLSFVDIYKAHMDAVNKDGLLFTVIGEGEYRYTDIKAYTDPAQAGILDAAIFITKANQLRSAVKNALPCIGPDTVAVSLINGLGNDEVLEEFFPREHIIIGSGVIGTELPEPGHCIAKPVSGVNMNFGALKKSEASERVCCYLYEHFKAGGMNPMVYDDVMPVIWKKVIVNCAVCGCCSILGLKEGPIEDNIYGAQLYRKVIGEACAVAAACGYPIDPDDFTEHVFKNVIKGNYDYYPSMAQDMLIYKRPTEIDALNGKIAELGRRFGIAAPVNEAIALIVKCRQDNYNKIYPNG